MLTKQVKERRKVEVQTEVNPQKVGRHVVSRRERENLPKKSTVAILVFLRVQQNQNN